MNTKLTTAASYLLDTNDIDEFALQASDDYIINELCGYVQIRDFNKLTDKELLQEIRKQLSESQ